jgi:hypothetical protein
LELTFECPECGATQRVEHVERASETACGRCSHRRELRPGGIEEGRLVACTWCGTDDLYLQKDFPHSLGLGILVAGFAVSTVFWYFYMPISAFLALLATAALDVAFYYLVPDVTICYRCLGQHRGPGSDGGGRFASFDLAIGERYRQERLRVEEHRRKASQAEPARPS